MAERAGPGRAREFVMTGGLYDAPTLERWGVVNRVVGDDELLEKGMRFAHRLAAGPTKAHAATKRLVRAYLEGGVDRADAETPQVSGSLFETEDLQNAVRSFLAEGPGRQRSRALGRRVFSRSAASANTAVYDGVFLLPGHRRAPRVHRGWRAPCPGARPRSPP